MCEVVGEGSAPLQEDVGMVVWRRRGPPGGGRPAHGGAPMRHGRQRRSLWAAAGVDVVVAEVGTVAPGRAVRLAGLPISRYLAWGLPWWLRW